MSLSFWKTPYLRLSSDRGVFWLPLEQAQFSVNYIHSVHHRPVREKVRLLNSGMFLIYELDYDSYGVGMPDEGGNNFKIKDGQFVLELNRELPVIKWWVSSVAQPSLSIGSESWSLERWADAGQLLNFKGYWRNRWQILLQNLRNMM